MKIFNNCSVLVHNLRTEDTVSLCIIYALKTPQLMARDAQRPVRAWIGVYIALTTQVATVCYGHDIWSFEKSRSVLSNEDHVCFLLKLLNIIGPKIENKKQNIYPFDI